MQPQKRRFDVALELKRSGQCNCAQAVACAYADVIGLDSETIAALSGGFGGGMGCMEGTCGAIVGAGLVCGARFKSAVSSKRAMKNIVSRFLERTGATQCRQIKGVGSGRVLRDCNDCIADVCEFLDVELSAV